MRTRLLRGEWPREVRTWAVRISVCLPRACEGNRLLALTALTLGALATSLPASAAGAVCYDVDVVVNGDAVVDESGCEELPL